MFKRSLAIVVVAFTAGLLHAADPVAPQLEKRNAVSFDVASSSPELSARRTFFDGKLSLIGSVGYESLHYSASGGADYDSSYHVLDLGLGIRRNFLVAEKIRPFAQLQVNRTTANPNPVAGAQVSSRPQWHYAALGGIEFFIARRLSLEGSAGVAYSNTTEHADTPPTDYHSRTFNTFRSTVGVNFYF